jgi:hypothetical protein
MMETSVLTECNVWENCIGHMHRDLSEERERERERERENV